MREMRSYSTILGLDDVVETLAVCGEHRGLRGLARQPVQDEPAQQQRQHRRRRQPESARAQTPVVALRAPLELRADHIHRDVVAHEPALVHDRFLRARRARVACLLSLRLRALPCAGPGHGQC